MASAEMPPWVKQQPGLSPQEMLSTSAAAADLQEVGSGVLAFLTQMYVPLESFRMHLALRLNVRAAQQLQGEVLGSVGSVATRHEQPAASLPPDAVACRGYRVVFCDFNSGVKNGLKHSRLRVKRTWQLVLNLPFAISHQYHVSPARKSVLVASLSFTCRQLRSLGLSVKSHI